MAVAPCLQRQVNHDSDAQASTERPETKPRVCGGVWGVAGVGPMQHAALVTQSCVTTIKLPQHHPNSFHLHCDSQETEVGTVGVYKGKTERRKEELLPRERHGQDGGGRWMEGTREPGGSATQHLWDV